MMEPEDAGQIVVTASHGALSGGRPGMTLKAFVDALTAASKQACRACSRDDPRARKSWSVVFPQP
jgi:hypothetical protein